VCGVSDGLLDTDRFRTEIHWPITPEEEPPA
jgi:hypothetical protein